MQCYIILKKHKNAPVWKTLIKFNLKETLIEKNLIQKCKWNSLYHPFHWEMTRAFYVILFVMNGKLTSWSFIEGNTLLCYFIEHGSWVRQPGMWSRNYRVSDLWNFMCWVLSYCHLPRVHTVITNSQSNQLQAVGLIAVRVLENKF